eukprot:TRINITY_DN2010_c3_g6_i1.p2 TRINITY_DN2010_c3_g6~~TRINITY_DN2010_c3_g6_i1.p2  ORF type:complete len:528 (+),score=207.23 TRINITY_DN2010_c3_g6_i1:70-1584(+)
MTLDRMSRSDLDDESIVGFSKPGKKTTLVGQIGNFSVQYNLSVASMAVKLMTSFDDTDIDGSSLAPEYINATGDFHEADWAKYNLLGAVFLGAVIGMLGMGYLGDLLGRRLAMLFTLALVVFGALGCALLAWGSDDAIFAVICVCRLLVGVGVGGIYPLSAASSAEAKSDDDNDDTESLIREKTAARVGWAFFWQVPGSLTPYLVSLILLGIHSGADGFSTNAQFRILFALGAVPAAIVLYLTWHTQESKEFLAAQKMQRETNADPTQQFSPWMWARAHPKWPEMRNALIGTAGTWFIYDVSYYGTVIFTPTILHNIFGDDETLEKLSYQGVIVGIAGIPGCITGIWVLKKYGCYFLNLWGFVFMAVCFAALGTLNLIADDRDSFHYPLFVLFIILNFALQSGPSVATFVMPAMCFPTEVKSSFHGVSAAAAKLGAVAGTFMYKPMADATSLTFLMYFQAGCSLLGALLTYFFIPRTDECIVRPEDEEEHGPSVIKSLIETHKR